MSAPGSGLRPVLNGGLGQSTYSSPGPAFHPAAAPINSSRTFAPPSSSYGSGSSSSYSQPYGYSRPSSYTPPSYGWSAPATNVVYHASAPSTVIIDDTPSYHGRDVYRVRGSGNPVVALVVFAILFATIVCAAAPEMLPAMFLLGVVAGTIAVISCAARSIRSS